MTTTFDIVRDTFTRTVTDDWGQADNGVDYEIVSGAAADFDVAGGYGTIIHPTAAATHQVRVPGTFKNVAGFLIIRTSAISTGAHAICDVLLRYVNGSNFVAARVEFSTSGNAATIIYKVVGGVVTSMATEVIAAYSANQDWAFRFEINDITVRTKLWGANGLESPVWDTSGGVSDIATPGRVMLQTRRETGNTNANLVLSFTELEVTSTIPTIEILPQFLNDYEFKFGQNDDALVLNGGNNSISVGSPLWDVHKVTGLDLPDVKVSSKEFDGIDGGVVEAANISMRTIRLEGTLYAHQDDSLEGYLDALKANYAPVPRQANGMFFDPSQKPFFIKPPGQPERFIFAKCIGLKYDWDAGRRFNSTPFQIILQAQVPTLFSPQLHVATTPLVAGTEYTLQVYNAGNYHSYAVVRFYQIGNFPTISMTHVEQDAEVRIALGVSGGAVDHRPVEINFRQRTVFALDDLGGENYRRDVLEEGWWRLAPGMNTIKVESDVSNSGWVEILWRDEWF